MSGVTHAPAPDRTRAKTWPPVNERLDIDAQLRLREAASAPAAELTRRLTRLDHEWNFDRTLEAEASLLGLAGLVWPSAQVDARTHTALPRGACSCRPGGDRPPYRFART